MEKDKTLLNKLVEKPIKPKEDFKPKWLGYEWEEPKGRKEYTKDCVYVYDKRNNEIYYEDNHNCWYKSEYDKRDNVIYYKNSDGIYNKSKYDKNNNEIYFENNNNYFYKKEYDKKGNEIYFEDNSEYWWKREYDKNGNEVYYENSDKDWRKEIEGKKVSFRKGRYYVNDVEYLLTNN